MKTLVLECNQGETFERTLRFKVRSTNVPVDIAGWVFAMQIRAAPDEALAATAAIVIRTPSTDGIADLTISDAITKTLDPRTYKFDIRVSFSGKIKYHVEGDFIITPSITRS